jgi:hypothetical protein
MMITFFATPKLLNQSFGKSRNTIAIAQDSIFAGAASVK